MRRFLPALLTIGLASAPAAAGEGALWVQVASLPAGGNAGLASGLVGGRMMVAGGTDLSTGTKRALDTILAFDPGANRWRECGRLPRAFYYGSFADDGASLFILGGADQARTRADGWAIGPDGESRAFTSLPSPSGYTGCTTLEGWCYILGGTRDVRDVSRMTAEFLRVDLKGRGVELLPAFPGGPIIQPALAAAPSGIYAFGGGGFDRAAGKPEGTRGAWCFGPATHTWRRIRDFPYPVRAMSARALDPGHILIAGGTVTPPVPGGPTASARCFVYDLAGDSYHPLPDLPFAAMLMGLQRVGPELYLVGGEDLPRHRNNSVYRAGIARLLALGRGP